MLYGLVMAVHVVVSLVLMAVILLQGGRGGLSETLAGGTAQSLFGGGVTTVLTRITGACAVIFMVTCLSLAYLSMLHGRSVIDQLPPDLSQTLPMLPGVSPGDIMPPVSPTSTGAPAAPASPTPSSEAPLSSR